MQQIHYFQIIFIGGRWSIGRGGVTYTFRNGISVTGHGDFNSAGVRVSIPIGRKRRAVEDQLQVPQGVPLSGGDDLEDANYLPAAATTTTQHKTEATRDKCAECVEIKSIKPEEEGAVKNATLANNDFVMIVRFIDENKSADKMEAKIKFEVTQVVKSPLDTVKVGEKFTINAKLATCPCLTSLDPGHYVVTGSMDSEKRLVLSSVLLEFEE